MKEAGYVYILTNPSFKEDWVKIGKSSRPVDIRSKELDNTAVPLPFEIYATLKTTKYSEVERAVHQTIDSLTDLRIRQNTVTPMIYRQWKKYNLATNAESFFGRSLYNIVEIMMEFLQTLHHKEIAGYQKA